MAANSHKPGARAGKAAHSTFNNNLPDQPRPVHPGLVANPLVTPDYQVAVLTAIDESGPTPLGDLVGLVPDYPNPVAAAFAMADAGIIEIEPVPVVDAHTRVTRRMPPRPPVLLAPAPTSGNPPGSDDAMAALPPSLTSVSCNSVAPTLTVVAGNKRRDVARVPTLKRAGIYFALWYGDGPDRIYVGRSSSLDGRVATGAHLKEPRLPDVVALITDANDAIDERQSKILERMAAEAIECLRGVTLVNGSIPQGAAVELDEYVRLAAFLGAAMVMVKSARLTFEDASYRDLMAGPRLMPDEKAPPRIDGLPEGERHRLVACGAEAEAIATGDGSWIVLRGSKVRALTVDSAAANISARKARLLSCGVLVERGELLELTRDLALPSPTMAAHFVTGAKTAPSFWKPLADAATELVEPRPSV